MADDSDAVACAFATCSRDSVVIFSEDVDYNIFKPVVASNLSNVGIHVLGNLHLPQNITAIQVLVNERANTTNNVTGGWINSYGQAWWDANPVNGTGTAARPHLISFNTANGSMRHFKSRKPIGWNVYDTIIDDYSTSNAFPFNTDGFDVTRTNIKILDSVIFNGDDTIAVQSGSHNFLFQGSTISYQSHGMSIGSLGQNQALFANVSNITFNCITVINTVYAARFKSWLGGQGLAKNISWSKIRVYNVTFPIFVT